MKLKQILIIAFLLLFITPNLSLYSITTSNPRAQAILTKIQKLPEVRKLIEDVEKEGSIKVEVQAITSANFEAFWDSRNRFVRINEKFNQKEGVFICSLIFELHNAATDRRFKQLYEMAKHGQISKDKYVENVERMEHQNALNTSVILEKGIRLGIFNADARWFILRDFSDHYKVQQMHGHSDWIAGNYDRLRHQQSHPYKGTISTALSSTDKQNLMRYMKIKDDLESPVDEQARKGVQSLHQEYDKLTQSNPNERHRALALMQDVLQGNAAFDTIKKTSAKHNTAVQN